MPNHERYLLLGHLRAGDDQVSLVLAIAVVEDNDELACQQRVECRAHSGS